MTYLKPIAVVLAGAFLIGGVGTPALAKKQTADQTYTTKKQAKKAKKQSGQDCHYTAPPFMYNPRFMNRGFFKKKCSGESK